MYTVPGEELYLGSTPHPVTVANKGLQEFPKNVMILLVTVTWLGGVDPTYIKQCLGKLGDVVICLIWGTDHKPTHMSTSRLAHLGFSYNIRGKKLFIQPGKDR